MKPYDYMLCTYCKDCVIVTKQWQYDYKVMQSSFMLVTILWSLAALAAARACCAWPDACIALLLLALLLLLGTRACVAPPKSVGCALIFGNKPLAQPPAARARARRRPWLSSKESNKNCRWSNRWPWGRFQLRQSYKPTITAVCIC